jgi:predicted short-subunit dehydrogenase-like oxidoreductase (DUF2520 family)
MKINIIGAGKLGKTIAKLLKEQANIEILGIVNSRLESAQKACKEINQGRAYQNIASLPQSECTLIATPDNMMPNIIQELYQRKAFSDKHILFHCSGHLSSKVLKHPQFPNVFVASVHPLRSFADHQLAYKQFQGTFCAMEGDEYALTVLKQLFLKLGAIPLQLNSQQKTLYHVGSVFASNYLITLFQQARDCFTESGIEPEIAKQSILNLMQGTLNNLECKSSALEALTGPIQRGDSKTLATHKDALKHDPERYSLYLELGRSTLAFCQHNSEITLELNHLLQDKA